MTATAAEIPDLLAELNEATELLRAADEVPPAVAEVVDRLADALHADRPHHLGIDPYLESELFAGAMLAMKALRHDDVRDRRRDLRVALERLRQVVRDIDDSVAVGDDRPAKAVLTDLVGRLGVPQTEMAALLGVSARQLQRWLGPEGPVPEGRDAARVRIVAQVANNLRHVFTGPGVVQWFTREHPQLGRPPVTLLEDPLQAPTLLGLAVASRAQGA